MKTIFSSFLICLLFIGIHEPASACSCGVMADTKKRIERSDYVALVKVLDIASAGSREFYKIKVAELILYKGNVRSEILVDGGNRALDSTYWTSCDMDIQKGEVMLVFAYNRNNQVQIDFCSGSMTYMNKDGYRDLFSGYTIDKLNEVNTYFSKPLIKIEKQNGTLNLYYSNGNKEATIHFKNGLKNGPSKYYYEDGSIRGEESYLSGNLNGLRKSFYRDGAVHSITHFENGFQVDSSLTYEFSYTTKKYYLWSSNYYNKKGLPISNKTYHVPLPFEHIATDMPYLQREWHTDTVKHETTTLTYHPNGMLAERSIRSSITYEYIGDLVRYNDAGNVIFILRVVKGKPNEIIYDASKAKSENNKEL